MIKIVLLWYVIFSYIFMIVALIYFFKRAENSAITGDFKKDKPFLFAVALFFLFSPISILITVYYAIYDFIKEYFRSKNDK